MVSPGPQPIARGPVWLTAAAVTVLLAVAGSFAELPFDELYFLAVGAGHLDWSFADQPPLVPVLSAAMHTIAPGSLPVLRLPIALASGAAVILAALTARELGGARRAQVLTAVTVAIGYLMYIPGRWLAAYTLDPVWWTALVWLLARWVRLRDAGVRRDRLLLAVGLVTALSLQTKFLVVAFWVVAGLAILAVGPRDLLRRPLFWAGAAIATLTALPGLVWQAGHGWPQLRMGEVVAREVAAGGGRLALVPEILLVSGSLMGVVLCGYGVWRLLRDERLRPFRFLGLTVLGTAVVFVIMGGRGYYAMGLIVPVIAAGAVSACRVRPAGWWRWTISRPVFVLSGLLAALVVTASAAPGTVLSRVALPLLPAAPQEPGTWDRFARTVGEVYPAVPEARRTGMAVLAGNYAHAAALDIYGPAHGLPGVHSGHRGYWYFGPPADRATSALLVGADTVRRLRPHFASVRRIAAPGPGTTRPGVWLAEDIRAPWSRIWPGLRHF